MGVKDLIKTLKRYTPAAAIPMVIEPGSAVGIDLSIYVYGWVSFTKTEADAVAQVQRGLLRQIEMFRRAGIRPVYVLDGAPDLAKSETLEQRRQVPGRVRIPGQVWGAAAALITAAGATAISAPSESDHLLAALAGRGWIVGVLTQDSDMLALGATLLKPPTDADWAQPWAAISPDIAKYELGLSNEDWQIFCVALGTDYSSRIMGPATLVKLARSTGGISAEVRGETRGGVAAMFGPLTAALATLPPLPPTPPVDPAALTQLDLGTTALNRIQYIISK